MFPLNDKQIARIQLFNAGELSVTNFVRLFLDECIEVEELAPTPADAQEMKQAYGETDHVSIPRMRGASYGSHAALQVIVLKRTATSPRRLQNAVCIVEIKGGQ